MEKLDMVNIGSQLGAIFFNGLSNTADQSTMRNTADHFTSTQSMVTQANKNMKQRRLMKAKKLLSEGEESIDLSGGTTWKSTRSDSRPKMKVFAKSIQRAFGPRRNHLGYNYAAQLTFMKDDPFGKNVGIARSTFEDLYIRVIEAKKASGEKPRKQRISLRVRLLMMTIYLTSKRVYKGMQELFGYSEAAVCKLVYKTIDDVLLLSGNAIKWPAFLDVTTDDFFKVSAFPGCIGSLDVMHLIARAPEKLHDEYRNAKGKSTIVLLAICDAQHKITFLSIGYPGTFTDQKCVDSTDLSINLDHIPNDNFPLKKYHLIGNDKLNLREGLMVPYKAHEIQSHDQVEFNRRLLKTQSITSETFAILKNRFQILGKMDMNLERVADFTTTCCILHNICLDNSDPWNGQVVQDEDSISPNAAAHMVIPSSNAAAKRDMIKDQMYLGFNYG